MHSRSIKSPINNCLWVCACSAFVAAAALAGCGGGAGSTSTTEGVTVPTSTTIAGQASSDDVYQACLDAIGNAVSQKNAENSCAQVRDAFQQCATAASNAPEGSARETALKACQKAADKATSQLESSP